MKHFYTVLAVCISMSLPAQQDLRIEDGGHSQSVQRNGPTEVQDGNGVLGTMFDTTLCGLNYVQYSKKLGQRLTPAGAVQPTSFPISGIPTCATTVKAYIWCTVIGTGIPVTVTVTNPNNVTVSFQMSLVGQCGDLCWGSTGTYTYRADVTSVITGNGNYIISGIPTSPTMSTSANDADGATLLVMYQDATASYTGSMHINDGAVCVLGGSTTQTMTGFNACVNSTFGKGFFLVADLQMNGFSHSIDGNAPTTMNSFNWWDYVEENVSINQNQASCTFTATASGDCFAVAVAGLYTQTACSTCTPSSGGLNISINNITPATCGPNGSASVNVSGGSGNYQITWSTSPAQYGLSANNLAGGSYNVSVLDTVQQLCGGITVVIPYTGPTMTVSTTPANCNGGGTATATVSGGQAPYTYSWAPSGGNNATATGLGAGTYTVTMTDGGGCTLTATATVIVTGTTMSINVFTTPDSCPSPSGSATAYVTGGIPPYTYLWTPGNQTTAFVSNMAAGSYTFTVTDNAGCVMNTPVTISAASGGNLSVASVPTQSCGAWVQLQATMTGNSPTYNWQPATYLSATNVSNPYCNPFSSITYTLIASSSCGTDTVIVPVMLNTNSTVAEAICEVTVDTAIHRCVIMWNHSTTPTWGSFTIYRETAAPGVYVPIATQHSSLPTMYTDWSSTPWFGTARYRIGYTDSCGSQGPVIAEHRTMFLQVTPSGPGYNLTWSDYEGGNQVNAYNILRGSNPGNCTVLASVSGTTFSYSDPNPPAGTVVYIIEAIHPNGGCNVGSVAYYVMHSNIWNSALVGVEENTLQNSLSVSPNPGSDVATVQCQAEAGSDVEITIIDALGRVVYTNLDQDVNAAYRKEIDLTNLAEGAYNVHLRSGDASAVTSLVIAR